MLHPFRRTSAQQLLALYIRPILIAGQYAFANALHLVSTVALAAVPCLFQIHGAGAEDRRQRKDLVAQPSWPSKSHGTEGMPGGDSVRRAASLSFPAILG